MAETLARHPGILSHAARNRPIVITRPELPRPHRRRPRNPKNGGAMKGPDICGGKMYEPRVQAELSKRVSGEEAIVDLPHVFPGAPAGGPPVPFAVTPRNQHAAPDGLLHQPCVGVSDGSRADVELGPWVSGKRDQV